MLCQSYLALFLSAVRFRQLQKTTSSRERERARESGLGCVLTCTLTLFLSLLWLAYLINITSPQRSSTKLLSDTTGFMLKRQQVSVTMRQQLSLNLTPFFCLCLFQILFQWELLPVVRWAPPFCCLCFCWRSPSSFTANAKAVSAQSGSLMCVCVCVCVRVCV